MKIKHLIDYLQQIAAKRPDAIVYVEDGMDPSDPCPITSIQLNKDYSTGNDEIRLSSVFYDEQPFDINNF